MINPTNNEYLSKNTIIERIKWSGLDSKIIDRVIQKINLVKSADVVPVRRGRWLEEDGIQICSECGEEHEWEDYRAPYCDTCGAKMAEKAAKEVTL